MSRPTRIDLLRKFFPELGRTGTGAETEAAIAINTRAGEAIMSDLIGVFDREYREQGPGVLCLNLALEDRSGYYVTLDEFCADLLISDGLGQTDVSSMLKDVISTTRLNNYDEQVLVMLIDNSHASLLPIPREFPAQGLQEAQEEATL